MIVYILFTLVYCHVFEGSLPKIDVNFEEDPIQIWYPVLFKHKSAFHFYQVQDNFVAKLKQILTQREPNKLTEAIVSFLQGNGLHMFEYRCTCIVFFRFESKAFLLICFVYDRFFVAKVCK